MKTGFNSRGKAAGILGFALPAVAILALPLSLSAQSAGYDLFQTGSGAYVDLSSIGLSSNVPLQGVPIQSSTGNSDTIMHRTAAVPSGGGSVPVNVHALYLKSSSHVTYQGQQADVYITVNNTGGTIPTSVIPQPDTLSASTGTVTVRTDGTFDSNVGVNADVIIVTAGGSPTNSSQILGHGAAPTVTLTSTNSTWSSSAPSGYPSSSSYSSGGFYGTPKHSGPHPVIPASCGTTNGTRQIGNTASASPSSSAYAIACVATVQQQTTAN